MIAEESGAVMETWNAPNSTRAHVLVLRIIEDGKAILQMPGDVQI